MRSNQSFEPGFIGGAWILIAIFAAMGSIVRPIWAEPVAPPVADAVVKPVEVGSLSIASLDRLGLLAKDLGVGLPPFLTAPGISQQFAFLGPDGLDADAPIGIVLYSAAGYEVAQGQGMVFVLPAKPGTVPLSSFTDAGGKPIEGHADSVVLNGVAFRRTEKDLMFSPTQEAAVAVPSNELADVFKETPNAGLEHSAAPFARFAFDLNAFRQVNPDRFKAFLDSIRGNNPPKDEAGRYGQDLVIHFVEQLGQIDFALGLAADDINLKLALAPAHIPAASSFSKPGMPTNVLARVDVAASPTEMIPGLDDLLKKASENIPLKKGQPGTPPQQEQFLKVLQAVSKLFLDGEAVSVGVAPQGDAVIVYVVQQKPKADIGSRLQKVADEFNKTSALLDEPGDSSSIVLEHYTTTDGIAVTHAKIVEKAETQASVDAADKDGVVYMTLSAGDEKHVESLISLKPRGQIAGLVHLEVDLAKALKVAEKSGKGPLSRTTEEQNKTLADLVAGRTLTVKATGEGDSIVFSTHLAKAFVAKAIAFLQGKGQDSVP